MRKIINFGENSPSFLSWAAVGGYEERRGPLGENFDFCDDSDRFGMPTWERAEGEMGRISLNIAMNKIHYSPDAIDVLLAGDLENQCVASSGGLYSFGIPYIGLYSACSTCTEALLLLSTLISKTEISVGATVTTSHNSAAERQFRTPIEYGGQRTPTAQWTATASGAFILGQGGRVKIKSGMVGKIVDGLNKDASNMGAAMARAAFDTFYTYFSLSDIPPRDFDYVVTGDLGKVGSFIFEELMDKEMPSAAVKHIDCGNLIYDKKSADVHSGASGCGCSASVLASHFLPLLEEGSIKNILFMSTGALMSPSSVMQGENILGVAPAIHISSE
ncbi:MAG: stage V sporulation protein AD [Ruminococcaceae bacterium]|nr:stage V sporulation protein AD [Oscillospiraceae bacterium]